MSMPHYPIIATIGAATSTGAGILVADFVPESWGEAPLTTLFGLALIGFLLYVIPKILSAQAAANKELHQMWREERQADRSALETSDKRWCDEIKEMRTSQVAHDEHMKGHWVELKDEVVGLRNDLRNRPCIIETEE